MRMHAFVRILVFLILLAPNAAWGQVNGSVDIFYVDPLTGQVDLGTCQGEAVFTPPLAGIFRAEIWVRLNGATANGISGVEGFIEGIDCAGWDATFTPVAGMVSDGSFVHALDRDRDTVPETRRGNIAFQGVMGPSPEDGCQVGNGWIVKVGELLLSQLPAVDPIPDDTWLCFRGGDPPSSLAFPCPLVTVCDVPLYTAVCVGGGAFIINPNQTTCTVAAKASDFPCPCFRTAIADRSWGAVKRLYR